MFSFHHLGDRRDRADGVGGQAVAGVAFQPDPAGMGGRNRPTACAPPRAPAPVQTRNRRRCAAPPPGHRGPRRRRAVPAPGRRNRDTRTPAAPRRSTIGPRMPIPPAASRPPSVVTSSRRSGTMQAACGNSFSANASISPVAAISRLSGSGTSVFSRANVVVADVPAVLAQMGGDSVGAGLRRQQCRPNRVRMRAAAGVAHGRDVIDVDAEPEGAGQCVGLPFRTWAAWSGNGEAARIEGARRAIVRTPDLAHPLRARLDLADHRRGAQGGDDVRQVFQVLHVDVDQPSRKKSPSTGW